MVRQEDSMCDTLNVCLDVITTQARRVAQYMSRQIPAAAACYPLRHRTTPFPEEKSILGVIYGVLRWADMNAATPLGAL